MQPGLYPLASGSRGNAILLVTLKAKLLIDCGLSAKALALRLSLFDTLIDEIDAILITHDHTDHISGLNAVAARNNIPIFANMETAKGIARTSKEAFRFKIFTTGDPFRFKDVEIFPFSIPHDTGDPVAFAIHFSDLKIGICTDLGFASPLVKKCLHRCHHLYIEANHEPSMVEASHRPRIYKERVLSRSGHLSNEQCANLLKELLHPQLRNITLAHLSQECNSPKTALEIIRKAIGEETPISIALQDKPSHPILFS